MKQICLEPYKPKHIETTLASGKSCGVGDIFYHQDGGVRITYWKCKSLLGRLMFLFNGKIELKQITDRMCPQAICINKPESQEA